MGKMKRQKRYKACDPFSKQKKPVKNDLYDRPPKKKDLKDDDEHFKETASFQKFQKGLDRLSNKKTANNEKQSDKKPKEHVKKEKKKDKKTETKLEQLPNESKQQYFGRLDQKIQGAVNTAMMNSKTLRKKRKLHLQARDDKKKQANKKDGDNKDIKDFSSLKDHVKFGETVDAPPVITAVPRKAPIKHKTSGLQLASLFENPESKDNKKTKTDLKRRREMTDTEKESFDTERQRAIDAYRLAKKKREMRNAMT